MSLWYFLNRYSSSNGHHMHMHIRNNIENILDMLLKYWNSIKRFPIQRMATTKKTLATKSALPLLLAHRFKYHIGDCQSERKLKLTTPHMAKWADITGLPCSYTHRECERTCESIYLLATNSGCRTSAYTKN